MWDCKYITLKRKYVISLYDKETAYAECEWRKPTTPEHNESFLFQSLKVCQIAFQIRIKYTHIYIYIYGTYKIRLGVNLRSLVDKIVKWYITKNYVASHSFL